MATSFARGCAVTALTLVFIVVAVPLVWLVYDLIRPRDPLDLLFQKVIAEAPVSNSYSSATGWDEAEVTANVCPKVNAAALTKLSNPPQHREAYPYAVGPEHLLPADIWEFAENKNIFAECSDHSFRVLSIELQESSGQCRAFVRPRPTCDP